MRSVELTPNNDAVHQKLQVAPGSYESETWIQQYGALRVQIDIRITVMKCAHGAFN